MKLLQLISNLQAMAVTVGNKDVCVEEASYTGERYDGQSLNYDFEIRIINWSDDPDHKDILLK